MVDRPRSTPDGPGRPPTRSPGGPGGTNRHRPGDTGGTDDTGSGAGKADNTGNPDSMGNAGGSGDAGDRVMRAIQNFSRSPARAELARSLYRTGDKELTPTQVDALETLASRREWHMHAFAHALGIHQGAASRTTDRLIRLGLAERRPDESDRRYVVVRATASGRRISERIRRDRRALMQEVMRDLSDEQRTELADMLDHITRTMDAIVQRAADEAGRPEHPAPPAA